jgi:hypothetical protein
MTKNSIGVSERQLEWIERYFFLKYDEAYAELEQEGLPREQEVRAFKEAMEVVTELRKEIFSGQEEQIEETAESVESFLSEIPVEEQI